jgi:hypothetical protein
LFAVQQPPHAGIAGFLHSHPDPPPAIHPIIPTTGVEYVRFVGCSWSFYPGVWPLSSPR